MNNNIMPLRISLKEYLKLGGKLENLNINYIYYNGGNDNYVNLKIIDIFKSEKTNSLKEDWYEIKFEDSGKIIQTIVHPSNLTVSVDLELISIYKS